MAKVNSLADPGIIEALYRASQAGVKVALNVRGICCLRPGVARRSENISVVSIVDRFLEHSRIFYFYQGGNERVFISSADWMPRNLDRRVELLVPVEDDGCRKELVAILETYFRDTVKARRLRQDGRYERVVPSGRRRRLQSQAELYERARAAEQDARRSRRTVFEPHRPPGATA
jgi:polyphosphate kinase